MKVSQKIGSDSVMAGVWSRRGLLLLAIAVVGVVLAGCSGGSYPLDIFSEMHYNQSYKSQEPPRLDIPVDGAVPVFMPRSDKSGGELYAVNCVMCHGQDMKGNGPVLRIMKDTYDYIPILDPDLTSNMAQGQTDQQLVSNTITTAEQFVELDLKVFIGTTHVDNSPILLAGVIHRDGLFGHISKIDCPKFY